MKVLLTGSSGQLGQELRPLLSGMGRLTAVDRQEESVAIAPTLRMDLSELHKVEDLLNRLRPDIIVNAAAYTAVDRAESEPETAFVVNGSLPDCLARWARKNDSRVVHFSTDYVFSGEATRPYREDDSPEPLNVYGESKLAGERAVQKAGSQNVVLRTSWVYSGHGSNFVLSMLALAGKRNKLSIVEDQTGCPTWARDLATATAAVIRHVNSGGDNAGGTYHYCGRQHVSWADFAAMIFHLAHDTGLLDRVPEQEAVASRDFPQVARRPAWSVLDTTAIEQRFGVEPADLETSLRQCLSELK